MIDSDDIKYAQERKKLLTQTEPASDISLTAALSMTAG